MKIHKNAGSNDKRQSWNPVLIVAVLLLVAVICTAIALFYRSLEREIYTERVAYLKEISEQIVVTTDSVSSAQYDIAEFFANHLQEEPLTTEESLAAFIKQEENMYAQDGLSLLAFDEQGNYYNAAGDHSRWLGSIVRIDQTSAVRQVEITTLPTATTQTDEMVFVHRMEKPLTLQVADVTVTHVAVVRDMAVFNKAFQITSFSGQGENYIISREGTKIYREQTPSQLIGDVYNVLKPLEKLTFQYDGSYEKLRRTVAEGESSSMEFCSEEGKYYYVTTSPMTDNGWSMLSILPSAVVSMRMQDFMRKTLFGMGSIALVIVMVVSFAVILVVRFQSGQKLLRQQAAANEALRAAAEAAEEASRAKTVFLSHMSHDIRTPINGIMGMTDIAARSMTDPVRLADCLGKITSASRHLLSLVNDVLDMSRIESGKIQLEDKPFYLDSLLDGCYSVVAGQALEKKLDLQTDFSGTAKVILRGDELHLRQILINILGNAVKFTPEGGKVVFTARNKVSADGREADLAVIIRDNGIGISEEFQKKIFEPFVQAGEISRSNYQGTGLGMSIVKQLLDLMGGTIEIESAPGKGSAFTVRLRLPVEDIPLQEQNAVDKVSLIGMHALLVEDNELNMEIARFMLEDIGIQVTPAWNGKEALDTFVRQPEGSFDVILMDVMMPVMDGLEAARRIRLSGKKDASWVPIVAMTANAFEEDRKAALEAGMNRHLTKPIERDALIRTLSGLRIEKAKC
ncbi:ATP-binding protein [Diplocloster hominis]|uniref:ATP-binding protein n=1 Tax=Diplocloster hominis TaxID=3079010 RepID=UPI0031BB7B7C